MLVESYSRNATVDLRIASSYTKRNSPKVEAIKHSRTTSRHSSLIFFLFFLSLSFLLIYHVQNLKTLVNMVDVRFGFVRISV